MFISKTARFQHLRIPYDLKKPKVNKNVSEGY